MLASQNRQQAPIAASKPKPKPKPERGLPTFKTQQQQQQQHLQEQQQQQYEHRSNIRQEAWPGGALATTKGQESVEFAGGDTWIRG